MKAPANVHVNLPDGDPGAPFPELAVVPEDLVQLPWGEGGRRGPGGTPRPCSAGMPWVTQIHPPPRKEGIRPCGRAHGPGHSERQT